MAQFLLIFVVSVLFLDRFGFKNVEAWQVQQRSASNNHKRLARRRGRDQKVRSSATPSIISTSPFDPKDRSSLPTHLSSPTWNRRSWLGRAMAPCCAAVVATSFVQPTEPSWALVKGVAPPSSKSKVGDRPKCTNIDECQALAEQRAKQEQAEASDNALPSSVTPGGTRYRDVEVPDTSSETVQDGDEVQLLYKVLKLGKRSYDGLSGEGTVIFSRGYGLEDDESAPGQTSFTTTVGSYSNIVALNEALVGMKVGGTRRFAVLPQKGWRKPGRACDGGPGGAGAGGDIKTDFVVVPTAQLVAEEACFDPAKQPFPLSYAQNRRMAQRFDQSLIMEVQVISAKPSTSGF